MSGKKVLKQWYGPFLESFGQDCVISISKSTGDNLPSIIPVKTFEIDQDALQFDNGERRMCVV